MPRFSQPPSDDQRYVPEGGGEGVSEIDMARLPSLAGRFQASSLLRRKLRARCPPAPISSLTFLRFPAPENFTSRCCIKQVRFTSAIMALKRSALEAKGWHEPGEAERALARVSYEQRTCLARMI